MDILEVLKGESCATDLQARGKLSCLHKLADLMARSLEGVDSQKIFDCLMEREKVGSTGFEDGIAIPHGKMEGIDDFAMCIAVSPRGIHYESMDGKKSHIFFVLIGPDGRDKEHLQLLAQVSRISRNPKARREFLNAPTPFVLKEIFTRFISDTGGSGAPQGKDKLFMIILYEQNFFEDILDIFLERGIRGATVVESSGIKDDLSNIPLFSNFFNFLGGGSNESKTIMTTVKESEVQPIVREIEEIMGDLDTHTGAMVMALDMYYLKGSMEL